ncbi:MAG TPA: carboxylesterase family protein [Novosphingobium sp.]
MARGRWFGARAGRGDNGGAAACGPAGRDHRRRGRRGDHPNALGDCRGLSRQSQLSDEDRPAAGNYGPLDQIPALRWIKANAARFGADPARITLAALGNLGLM